MPDYRIYFVGRDGHFKSAVDLYGESDDAAIVEAIKLADGSHIELWCRERRVTIINEKYARQA